MTSSRGTTFSLEQVTALLAAARGVLSHAYAPYSQFRVGAALLARDGQVFSGVNVENSSHGLTLCAERSAMVNAVSAGVRDFLAIAVVCEQTMPCMPCGACRQVLHEFTPDLVVVVEDTGGPRLLPLADLLPHAFRLDATHTEHQPPPSDNG
jgi:cytidine deaminase